jgi:hypothetical protein
MSKISRNPQPPRFPSYHQSKQRIVVGVTTSPRGCLALKTGWSFEEDRRELPSAIRCSIWRHSCSDRNSRLGARGQGVREPDSKATGIPPPSSFRASRTHWDLFRSAVETGAACASRRCNDSSREIFVSATVKARQGGGRPGWLPGRRHREDRGARASAGPPAHGERQDLAGGSPAT